MTKITASQDAASPRPIFPIMLYHLTNKQYNNFIPYRTKEHEKTNLKRKVSSIYVSKIQSRFLPWFNFTTKQLRERNENIYLICIKFKRTQMDICLLFQRPWWRQAKCVTFVGLSVGRETKKWWCFSSIMRKTFVKIARGSFYWIWLARTCM